MKDDEEQVEALKRTLKKKLVMKLKKVKQKIVMQHQHIVDGKENLKSLVEGVGGGGGGSRRVGVNPQGQAPPHIFSCTTGGGLGRC